MPDDSRDARLAALLGGLVEQRRSGHAVDLEAVARENPDLAVELRELWAVAGLADEFASAGNGGSDDPTQRPASPIPSESMDEASDRFGDYDLLQIIGEGGMGVVYKARQRSLGRVVA